MLKILTLNQIALKGLERFSQEHYEVSNELDRPDAILVRSQRLSSKDLVPTLKAIARAGAGVNNIPVDECTKRGIPVFNTPGANANAVKELVMSGLLLASRGIIEGIQFVRELNIDDPHQLHKVVEKQKKQFQGKELAGKTIGVAGLGAIGSAVAEMALSMDMKVLGYDPGLSEEAARRLSKGVWRMDHLSSLVAQSDYVTLHLPVLENTKGLINENLLKSFKKGCRLLNFARDEIVDVKALHAALDTGILSRYVSDFPHPTLVKRSDTILIPHLGASTEEAEENCAIMAADQLVDFLEHGNIKNSVNYPTLSLEQTGGYRIAFSNENIPKILGKVLLILANRNLNILDMLNKSLTDIAYNLIDIETSPPEDLKEEILSIEGVISVRYL